LKEFIKAVQSEQDQREAEEGAITFIHWGKEVTFYEPSDGQQLMMLSMGGRNMSKDSAGKFIQLVIALGDDETQEYFNDLMMDRKSGFTLKGDGGLFDIWETISEEWSGKASEKPSGSRKSPSATGKRSTGTSPRRVSTSSASR
jgi:sugar lactone lactonase YvrE